MLNQPQKSLPFENSFSSWGRQSNRQSNESDRSYFLLLSGNSQAQAPLESRFGECAEILSGCQMPPHSALPLLRQRDHISPTRWQSGVAMRGRLQASRTTPPRKALLPRARKYGQQRVLAVSSFGVGFSCGELPRPMSNPSKGLPDLPEA